MVPLPTSGDPGAESWRSSLVADRECAGDSSPCRSFSLWPVAEGAAQSPPSLGYAAAKSANPKRLDVFKQGLTELGYVESKNIRIDYREGVLDADYHAVMAEFLGRKMNIILAANA